MTARSLRMAYREIPAVTGCKADCGRCCGPVPWTPAEIQRLGERRPPHAMTVPAPGGPPAIVLLIDPTNPGRCPLLDEQKRCSAHDARPLMCRLFGAADAPGLVCPFGAAARRPLSDAQARRITVQYKKDATDGR